MDGKDNKEDQSQPTIYEDQPELVIWLNKDLRRQRQTIAKAENILFDRPYTYNGKLYENKTDDDKNEYLKTKIDNEKLTLNIGSKNNNIQLNDSISESKLKRVINFKFDLEKILMELGLAREGTALWDIIICPFSVNMTNVIFKQEADFNRVKFSKEVFFNFSEFKGLTKFQSSIFDKEIKFNDAVFHKYKFDNTATFSRCIFNNTVTFDDAIFENEVNFSKASFNEDKNMLDIISSFNNTRFKKNVSFSGNTLKQKMDFRKAKFKQSADFSACTFEKDVSFYLAYFQSGGSNFEGAVFKGKTYFQHVNFGDKVNFNKASFEQPVYFGLNNKKVNDESSFDYDTHDEKNRYKDKTIFNEACFERVIFKDEADFKYVNFNSEPSFSFASFSKEIDFKYAIFKKGSNFDNTIFEGQSAFWGIELNGNLNFRNIKTNEKTNMYFGNINYISRKKNNTDDKYIKRLATKSKNAKIIIKETVITGRIDLNNANVKEINLETSSVVGQGVISYVINFFDNIYDWETACIFKNEEIKKNNNIKALKYKAIEAKLYKEHLKDKGDKSLRTRAEIFSLGLSELSNNHGQDWFRAVLFTLIIGLLFFTLSQVFLYICITQVIFILLFSFIIYLYLYDAYLYLYDAYLYLYDAYLYLYKYRFYKKKYHILIDGTFIFILLIILVVIINRVNINPNLYYFIKDFFNYLIPTNFDLMKAVAKIDITVSLNPNMKINELIETTVNASSNSTASYSNLGIFNLIGFYSFYILGKLSIGYGVFEVVQAFRKFNSKG